MKREEKRLRAKLQLQQGEHDDLEGDDEDEDEDEEAAGWGAGKRAYYDADEVGVTMLYVGNIPYETCPPRAPVYMGQAASLCVSQHQARDALQHIPSLCNRSRRCSLWHISE